MFIFNPYWAYYMGGALKDLNDLTAGHSLSQHLELIVSTRTETERFIEQPQNVKVFPEALEQLKILIILLESLSPPNAPFVDRAITSEDIDPIFEQIGEIHKAFLRDRKHRRISVIVGIEKQRAFDVSTLIVSIQDAFAELSWKYFSDLTKREIKECGRCLAFERYTASGFHILRAIESETRDYIFLLTHAQPTKRDWGHYIDILTKYGVNPKLIAALDSLRNLDRNPLMHPEDWLVKDDAIGLFNLAMTTLDRLIADMLKQNLLRPEEELDEPATNTLSK